MNRLVRFYRIPALIGSIFLIYSCNEAPKGDDVTITEKQDASEAKGTAFMVDTAASKIRFTGHGVG